jgi:hypothetical protein
LAIDSTFRALDDKPKRTFGYDVKTSTHRVNGDWKRTKPLSEHLRLNIQTVGGLLHALPGWPLADGIDRSKYTPDSHQLLVSDMLATNWFQGIDGFGNLGRTRVLVADEGGTGKTLGVSLAVRWTTIQQDAIGPVLVLVPPLLKEHWLDHLQAVFSDDPDRIVMLKSARFFDPVQHQNQIVIMSKFSWIHHWSGREDEVTPLCVVIDEAHQGRTGMTVKEKEEEGGDEEAKGILLEEEESFSSTKHAKVLQQTCAKARFAVGVTATPINIHTREIEYILAMLGSESQWMHSSDNLTADINLEWQSSLAAIANWARNANHDSAACPIELLTPLSTMLLEGKYPRQWKELGDIEIDSLIQWINSVSDGSIILNPSTALRRVRDWHPYGRHLSMVLRMDLIPRKETEQQQFRIRKERSERLSIGKEIHHFLSEIRRDDKKVGLLDTLNQSTRIVCSHRLNPNATSEGEEIYEGTWDFTNEDYLGFWGQVRTMDDPRVDQLMEQILTDLDYKDEGLPGRITQRGCVIFTDWRGTVETLRIEIKNRYPTLHNVKLRLFELTGSTDVNTAKRRLEECERLAAKDTDYPILICTAAGEVGLDMEWASTLVHWDLNSNPQRMEQRTWRLDRRISSLSTRKHYSIIHMICDDIPHHDTLEMRINDRFNQAAESLGLIQRLYIPEGTDEVETRPGGSLYSPELLDDEISHLNVMFHGGESQDCWPGPRLREAERVRCAAVVKYCTSDEYIQSIDTILQQGFLKETNPWPKELELGDPRVRNIRDMEFVSTALSRKFSPQIPIIKKASTYACSWESLQQGFVLLPNLSKVYRTLFTNVLDEFEQDLKIISISIDLPVTKCILAINKEIASSSEGIGSVFHDRGLRLISLDGNQLFVDKTEENERKIWPIIYESMKLLITDENNCSLVESPFETLLEDIIGKQEILERIKELKLRNEGRVQEKKAILKKNEELGEDDEGYNRRIARLEGLIRDIESRGFEIERLREFSHILTPIAIVEGTK